ncbi:hypothetical protein J3Q64DRAFT_1718298 [Phycomyces blakesleeanus]|uniref:Uncharacterized protein n=1 Tax=Phycomyces blakesleeanus TaxID=4837 RepID=A0ABR3BBX1_PHYBL
MIHSLTYSTHATKTFFLRILSIFLLGYTLVNLTVPPFLHRVHLQTLNLHWFLRLDSPTHFHPRHLPCPHFSHQRHFPSILRCLAFQLSTFPFLYPIEGPFFFLSISFLYTYNSTYTTLHVHTKPIHTYTYTYTYKYTYTYIYTKHLCPHFYFILFYFIICLCYILISLYIHALFFPFL